MNADTKRDRAFANRVYRADDDASAVIVVDDGVISLEEARRRGMVREIENPYTRTTIRRDIWDDDDTQPVDAERVRLVLGVMIVGLIVLGLLMFAVRRWATGDATWQ